MADVFKFRLQTVLRLRELKRRQSMIALARANNELHAAKSEMADSERRRTSARTMGEELRLAGIPGSMNKVIGTFEDASAFDIAAAHKHIEAAKQLILKRQEELRKTTREKDAVEILREKAIEEWKMEQRRSEAKALSEVALRSHARGPGGMK